MNDIYPNNITHDYLQKKSLIWKKKLIKEDDKYSFYGKLVWLNSLFFFMNFSLFLFLISLKTDILFWKFLYGNLRIIALHIKNRHTNWIKFHKH